MTPKEIAAELVAGCREDRTKENLDLLYSDNAVSVEAQDMGQGRESKGLDAIKAKHDWWENAMEYLGGTVSEPMMHGDDRFAVIFRLKARERATGEETEMEEVGIYTIAGGKIVREEFYY
ncbi:SnoaL-like domain-containing protein [Primorskyibacter sp. S87]|uniref:SnoaL-like domain-containing protein n=1 Tax=Primorskyibacter sp. S87 TaxID=3415126 RepID=UPI003C7D52F8